MRPYVITACAALVIAGCRSQPYVNAHIESVNAEYRQLEDYVYALEDENSRLHGELEAVRTTATPGAGSATTVPSSGGGLIRRAPSGIIPRRSRTTEPSPDVEAPLIEVPGTTPAAPPRGGRSSMQRPATDSLAPTDPANTPPNIEFPLRRRDSSPPGEEVLPVPSGQRSDANSRSVEPLSAVVTDKKITHLFLNPLQTGGADFDGRPGDDGLRIVMEPQNAAGQSVREAGALSIVLLDPSREGEAARVARWDFDAAATRQLLADSSPGRGIKVEVPWPSTAPDATRLKLFVRYEAPDGRRLQTDREIFLTPPGQAISRWTPRSPDRQPAAELATATHADMSDTASTTLSDARPARPNWSPNR